MKGLLNNNYVVRRLCTETTQTLHRVRLRNFRTEEKLPNITVAPENVQPDNEVQITHEDLYAEAWASDFGDRLIDETQNRQPSRAPEWKYNKF